MTLYNELFINQAKRVNKMSKVKGQIYSRNDRSLLMHECDLPDYCLGRGSSKALAEAFMDAHRKNIVLSGADLRGADFSDQDLKLANFQRCDLAGASFARTDIKNASFRNAALDNTNFEDAQHRGADFRGTRHENYDRSRSR